MAASAQTAILPQVGATLYKFYNEDGDAKSDARLGYQAGFSVRAGNTIYLQPGLSYQATSFSRSVTITTGPNAGVNKGKVSISTARADLLVGVRALNADKLKIQAMVGPSYSILLNVKDDKDIVTKDNLENGYLGGRAGIGLETGFLGLYGGYDLGLTGVNRNTTRTRYGGWYLNLGVVIPLQDQNK